MNAVETVLSGILLVFVSGYIGNYLGKRGKVCKEICEEHRINCAKLICQKIDSLSKRVDELKKAVDGKLLGL